MDLITLQNDRTSIRKCFKRTETTSRKNPPPTLRRKSCCMHSLHNTNCHDICDCGSRKRDDGKRRRLRSGQHNDRHNNSRSAHANTATTPSSRKLIWAYVSVTHVASAIAAGITAATFTSFLTPPCLSSPPVGVGIYFIAAPPINIATQPVEFTMTADSGVSSHFFDNIHLSSTTSVKHYTDGTPITTRRKGLMPS